MNVLIISHGHPALSAGGAERAAYSLFEHLKDCSEISQVVFAARATAAQVGHDAAMGLFRGRTDEPIVSVPTPEWPSMMSSNYDELRRTVDALLDWAKPDVVHVHHYAYWSLDLLEVLYSLGAKVVLTLHEYMAICHNLGQMVTTSGRLCEMASPAECHGCFPQVSSGMFFLRERTFKAFLAYCDYFIAPSQFLRDRYVDWGLDPSAVQVVENPLAPSVLAQKQKQLPALLGASEHGGQWQSPNLDRVQMRVGYFGQLNRFKGVDLLLRAVQSLAPEHRAKLEIGIHGANLETQDKDFQGSFARLLKESGDAVTFYGPYRNELISEMMERYDWIVVPSTWWENSPVVIQEAHAAGKPVLCARIGGMAEKVTAGSNGLYFEAGNEKDLARKLVAIAQHPFAFREDREALLKRHQDAVQQHLAIYRDVQLIAPAAHVA